MPFPWAGDGKQKETAKGISDWNKQTNKKLGEKSPTHELRKKKSSRRNEAVNERLGATCQTRLLLLRRAPPVTGGVGGKAGVYLKGRLRTNSCSLCDVTGGFVRE